MDETCGTHERNLKCMELYLESVSRRQYLEDLGVGGRIILKYEFWGSLQSED